jgi:TPR repeat protein
MNWDSGSGGAPKNHAYAEILYRRGCEEGKDASACTSLKRVSDERKKKEDMDRATDQILRNFSSDVPRLRQQCQGHDTCKFTLNQCDKDPKQCFGFANVWDNGSWGMPKNHAYAAAIYRRGCDAGDGNACSMLFHKFYRGEEGVKADLQEALRLARRGCDLNEAGLCNQLQTEGSADDKAMAKRRIGEMCDHGDEGGCIYAGRRK